MKKHSIKKLSLSRETLATLDGEIWKRVAGGVSKEDSDCTYCTGAGISHSECCPTKV